MPLPVLLAAAAALLASGALALLARGLRPWANRAVVAYRDLLGTAPRRTDRAGPLRRTVLHPLAVWLARSLPSSLLGPLRRACVRAGQPLGTTGEEVLAAAVLSGAAGLLAGLCAGWALGASPACALPCALAASLLPLLWLHDRVEGRRRALVRALPYALDLLTLSVEAGLDFVAALAKVEEKSGAGPLRDELALTLRELRLGKTREEALRGLDGRLCLRSIHSFVQALIQADRLGTSLSKTLRNLSVQMRQERSQRAEKLANEAPVKLLIPLIGCIFPTIFLVLFAPLVFQMLSGGS